MSASTSGHIAKFNGQTDPPLVGAADVGVFGALFQDLVQNAYAEMPESWKPRLTGKAWKELDAATQAPVKDSRAHRPTSDYVDPGRLEELRAIKSASFDLSKLIRACEELNICFAQECYVAVAVCFGPCAAHIRLPELP